MTRKMLTASLVVIAVLLSVLSLGGVTESVEAQGAPQCAFIPGPYNYNVRVRPCADAVTYSGPFTNAPAIPGGPLGFGSANPVASAAGTTTATGTTTTTAGLAVTGSESAVLGYVGTSLIAFGAVALGSRRKFFQGARD